MEFDIRRHKLVREFYNRDREYHSLSKHIVHEAYASVLKKKIPAKNIKVYFEEYHPNIHARPAETIEEISLQGLIDFIVTENTARFIMLAGPPWWNWHTRWNESPVPDYGLAGSSPAGGTKRKDDE